MVVVVFFVVVVFVVVVFIVVVFVVFVVVVFVVFVVVVFLVKNTAEQLDKGMGWKARAHSKLTFKTKTKTRGQSPIVPRS